MLKEEFVKTEIVGDYVVNIGMDDYGQQYFMEFVDKNEMLHTVGFGAYNLNWTEDMRDYISRLK